jgi:hypothetical protein
MYRTIDLVYTWEDMQKIKESCDPHFIGVTKIQKQVNMLNGKGKRMFMYEMC